MYLDRVQRLADVLTDLAAMQRQSGPQDAKLLSETLTMLHAASGDWLDVPLLALLLIQTQQQLLIAKTRGEPPGRSVENALLFLKRQLRRLPYEVKVMLGVPDNPPATVVVPITAKGLPLRVPGGTANGQKAPIFAPPEPLILQQTLDALKAWPTEPWRPEPVESAPEPEE